MINQISQKVNIIVGSFHRASYDRYDVSIHLEAAVWTYEHLVEWPLSYRLVKYWLYSSHQIKVCRIIEIPEICTVLQISFFFFFYINHRMFAHQNLNICMFLKIYIKFLDEIIMTISFPKSTGDKLLHQLPESLFQTGLFSVMMSSISGYILVI